MRHLRLSLLALLLLASIAVGMVSLGSFELTTTADADPAFEELDPWVLRELLDDALPVVERYESLFGYFLAGYLAYREPDGAGAMYPGLKSVHGERVDALSGFSRMAPLIAAWLHSGRGAVVDVPRFGRYDLIELLAAGLGAGTNPASAGYWGGIDASSQTLVESADIALAIWLAGDPLWSRLSPIERERVTKWLSQAEFLSEVGPSVNWRLYPMMVNRVLRSLGSDISEAAWQENWDEITAAHVGDGWFRDRENHGVDYYNAWAFHYGLYWLGRIDPTSVEDFVRSVRREFVARFRYFVTPNGIPILGRSICYRTAASAPLVIAAFEDPDVVPPGEGRRSFDRLWRYFASRSAIGHGRLTQGYCAADVRLIERYMGPASCLWGLRSLVVAMAYPRDSAFWTVGERPLPVEVGDFEFTLNSVAIRVSGSKETGIVQLFPSAGDGRQRDLKSQGLRQRLAEFILRRPFRSNNQAAKYDSPRYASEPPFTGCPLQPIR